MNLQGAHTLLRREHKMQDFEPDTQPQLGLHENGSCLEREAVRRAVVLSAFLALPSSRYCHHLPTHQPTKTNTPATPIHIAIMEIALPLRYLSRHPQISPEPPKYAIERYSYNVYNYAPPAGLWTIVVGIATAVMAVFTFALWRTSNRQWRTMEKGLRIAQRAAIAVKTFEFSLKPPVS